MKPRRRLSEGRCWNAWAVSTPGTAKPTARKDLRKYLEQNVWPTMPPGKLERVMRGEEKDGILGYGAEGY